MTHRPAMGTTTRDNGLETGRTAESVGFVMTRTADACEDCGRPLVLVDGEWRPIRPADVFLSPLPDCGPGRHRYRRVPLDPVIYADGSAITPSHESCARCGKVKRGSFDIR